MSVINLIKNLSIIVDFVLSIIASALKNSQPGMSDTLFMLSGIVLFVAVICVVIELIKKK